ncbi:MAG: hypothetical protein M1168_02600 [Candidatus Marsarchaeota archaeon]|nr:hypothetical protein [Candidatus Marsarchaeota archaeon]MCL5094848.1 hypothetical protein [Candidatus Marsarchaeota archaeon]
MKQTTTKKSEYKNIRQNKEQCSECEFFFIKPQENSNAIETAQKLLSVDNIEEVFIVDGDYGFIAKSNCIDNNTSKAIGQFVSKNSNTNFHKLSSYYKIKK